MNHSLYAFPGNPTAVGEGKTAAWLLMALSDREVRLFGLLNLNTRLSALPCEWHDPLQAKPGDWSALFHEFKPTVLLSSWTTPQLDAVLEPKEERSLQYVCHVTGSIRNVVPRYFLEEGGLVSNWGGFAAPQVAEHALLLALSTLRRIQQWTSYLCQQPKASPTEWLGTQTLMGRRVGIHGYGNVARMLIELLRPFKVDLQVYSEGISAAVLEKEGLAASRSLRELFNRSEVLFECEALTPVTRGCVSAAILESLPDRALFVNVARGHLVDEPALLAELQSGRIFAALDVLCAEPIPSHTPFLNARNTLLSPHVAGPTQDQFQLCGELACRNIERFVQDEPVDCVVSLEAYDRST